MQTEEQLLRNKVKHLEDRLDNQEKAIGSINKIIGHFQMTENKNAGFQDLEQQLYNKGLAVVGKDIDHELI